MTRILLVFLILLCIHSNSIAVEVSANSFQALHYRNLGPTRGGRSSAVTGIPGQQYTFLMGTAGGVWKTANAGQTWENISDKFFESGSIGAIAVADSDANVIYVGTGQTTIRGNVALGVGVYKSVDGGKTWTHSGLREAGQIGRIRIDPENPDLVYVAALGNAFVPNEERGLFRSKDGGKTWEKVLYISAKTGVVDLDLDRSNPKILYAAAWTGQRKPWTIVSGSEESALYKTTDGGDTWTKVRGGLPQGVVGKIGVAISPANPKRIWAVVEAPEDGLFRSDDSGQTWKRLETNQSRRLYQRAWYYMHIFADPLDPQTVYILNVDQFRSRDGGVTFETIEVPHGDGHDLWINPQDTRILIMGNDGGACVSLDHGKNWSTLLNQPTAEMYNVSVDGRFPYRVYGAQQDNTTISLPSRQLPGVTPYEYWRDVGGGESGHIGFEFHSPDIIYAGSYGGEITRLNIHTGDMQNIMHYPQMEIGLAAADLRYRFNWNAPLRVSRHDPKALYYVSQYVHRSKDGGYSWEIISPDLSRNDKTKQIYSGEPITYENTGIEVYSNIFAFEESPLRSGVFWAGSDDGLVHISENDGKTWSNITPPALPEWATINSIEPSPHDPAKAYMAVHKYRLGDTHPYIYRTQDYGKTWALLTNGKNGIPANTPTRAIREDPFIKGLLYVGTESGMYVSLDDGANWQTLQLDLPIVPVTDLRISQTDLVLSTQGRSFWILDDITVLQQIASGAVPANKPYLLKPRDTYRMRMPKTDANPPNGALIFYSLPAETKEEVRIEIFDAQDHLIQTFSSEHPPNPNPEFPYEFMGSYNGDRKVEKKPGLNRFVWDLRYPPVDFSKGTIVWGFLGGSKVPPGTYKATLSVRNLKQTQTFALLKDPRVAASEQDLMEQFVLKRELQTFLNQIYSSVRTLRSVRTQARDAASGKNSPELTAAADQLWKQLSSIEEELMQPRNEADQDTENYPTKLDNQIAYLALQLEGTDGKPTTGQIQRTRDLEMETAALLFKLSKVLDQDLKAFNQIAVGQGLPAIVVTSQ